MNILFASILAFFIAMPPAHAEEGDHALREEHQEQSGEVHLTPEQIRQIGLQVETVQPQPEKVVVRAPGSVAFNAYGMTDITSLVDGMIHARFVRLGERVKQGQKLVTLISTGLAQAQANYLRAEAEHRKSKQDMLRLKGLAAQKIVSRARLQQAESIHQSNHAALAAARATLASYGLRNRDIDMLIKRSDYGLLTLRAPRSGVVVADHFRLGQHIAAGALLMQIADTRTLWVEARVPATQIPLVRTGQSAAIVPKNGAHRYHGKVINIHPQLDAATRTAGVRLELANEDDGLHPGMFVDVEIQAGSGKASLTLPREAIQREDEKLIVFVEKSPGHYQKREVLIGNARMGRVAILSGLRAGERVVTRGAFSVASELAKAGFEED